MAPAADHTLLPCPFCGGKAGVIQLTGDGPRTVECDECHCRSCWGTEEEVIAAWNRRIPPAVPEGWGSAALEEDNRRLREAIRKADRRLDDLASVPLGPAAAVVAEAHLCLKGAIRQPAPDGEMSKG